MKIQRQLVYICQILQYMGETLQTIYMEPLPKSLVDDANTAHYILITSNQYIIMLVDCNANKLVLLF